jgi:leucyl aminopeptidase
MNYNSKLASIDNVNTACLAIGVYQGKRFDDALNTLNNASKGQLKRILGKNDFSGENGSSLLLYELQGIKASRVLLFGLGERKKFSIQTFAQAVGKAIAQLQGMNLQEATFSLPEHDDLYDLIRQSVITSEEAVYRFDDCKSQAEPPKKPLKRISFLAPNRRAVNTIQSASQHGLAIANGMKLAKDLANLPGNICTPTYLAKTARDLAKGKQKLSVSIVEEKEMNELGMGALLSVSRGSRQPAKLIVMHYKGSEHNNKPIAFVGKGLTFDAGGISIKPSAAMDEMKYDMCGGASVFGAIAACAELQLPINVVGVVPASENLPDGDANKPGDIVTSMSGQTIEVLNTDAEGRLILCDALTYTERFDPAAVIDIATLTGACVVALGHHATGLMANDDKLAQELLNAGDASHDRAWQLPLWDDYQKPLDSNFADMANIGDRSAGAITAGSFLSRFTKQYKWAHLDIAGTAWKSGADKGATGRPVPMLMQFLLKRSKSIK